jgi:hypothetical protein
LYEKLGKVNSDHDRIKRAAQMDEDVMVGLKKKLETAKSEFESLKRKRANSISPERVIAGILKRPAIKRNRIPENNRKTIAQIAQR